MLEIGTCANFVDFGSWVLNDNMRRQGLVVEIGVKVAIALVFERVGEAECFV